MAVELSPLKLIVPSFSKTILEDGFVLLFSCAIATWLFKVPEIIFLFVIELLIISILLYLLLASSKFISLFIFNLLSTIEIGI